MAVGEWEQHHIPGPAFDEGADRGLAFAHDQVAFPMPGHGPVLDRGGPFTDHDRVNDLALCPTAAGRLWAAGSPGGCADAG